MVMKKKFKGLNMNKKIKMLMITIFIVNIAFAQSSGTLQVRTTTQSTGGNYAPKNIVAVWIENEKGEFVKTLAAYANSRKAYLNTWASSTSKAGSAFNTVDAITGATRNSHGTIICSWNGTDYKGNEVGDGTYNLRFELTDKHSTGNLASFPISKGNVPQEFTPADVPSFGLTSISWKPASVSGIESKSQRKELIVNYNPSSGQLTVNGVSVKEIEIYNFAGQLVKVYSTSTANLDILPIGIYLIVVKTDTKIYSQKIMKSEE
jgi:hypothetical protein